MKVSSDSISLFVMDLVLQEDMLRLFLACTAPNGPVSRWCGRTTRWTSNGFIHNQGLTSAKAFSPVSKDSARNMPVFSYTRTLSLQRSAVVLADRQ